MGWVTVALQFTLILFDVFLIPIQTRAHHPWASTPQLRFSISLIESKDDRMFFHRWIGYAFALRSELNMSSYAPDIWKHGYEMCRRIFDFIESLSGGGLGLLCFEFSKYSMRKVLISFLFFFLYKSNLYGFTSISFLDYIYKIKMN